MRKMRVLMVEPGKHPYELEIEHTLEAMYTQRLSATLLQQRTHGMIWWGW
jgi:hypothetical protein